MTDRYSFTNFSTEPFTGRYGGVDYFFAPSETKEFDPDKHYMLKLLAKQLADRELIRGIRSVGRNPNNEATFGKSLDDDGAEYVVTVDQRLALMRKAIGSLADKPVPIPEEQTQEAGTTQKTNEDVKSLEDKVKNLTETVEALTSALKSNNTLPTFAPAKPSTIPVQRIPPIPSTEPMQSSSANMSNTREVLYEMALEQGLSVHEGNTKEELVSMLNSLNQAQVAA